MQITNDFGDKVFEHDVMESNVELHYTTRGATVHKTGCKHPADSKRPFDPTTAGEDDFFYVAPCART